jgi:hypothetical protein
MYLKITTFDKEVNFITIKVRNNLLKHLENLKNKVLQHKPGGLRQLLIKITKLK